MHHCKTLIEINLTEMNNVAKCTLVVALCVVAISYAAPVHDSSREIQLERKIATSIKWNGVARMRGGLLISIINFKHLNTLCNDLNTDIVTTTQTITTVTTLTFKDTTNLLINRLSFIILTLEKAYDNLISYTETYLLCSEKLAKTLRQKYRNLKQQLDKTWNKLSKNSQLIKRREFSDKHNTTSIFLNSTIITAITNLTRQNKYSNFKFLNTSNTELRTSFPVISTVDILAAARPQPSKEEFLPILIGLGAAFGGGLITGTLLNNNLNAEQITTLNENIHKVNENVKITNNRIDILSKNITTTISDIKTVLKNLVSHVEESQKINAYLWNLDQLAENAMNLLILFKLEKQSITLLEAGIINPELVDTTTVQNIIAEGITKFDDVEFPFPINTNSMKDILKLIVVEKISVNNFIILIPLFKKTEFRIYTLTPHPLRIKNSKLVLPKLTQLILVSNESYVLTDSKHLKQINNVTSVLTMGMPVWQHTKISCEMEMFRQNLDGMLTACTFTTLGDSDRTFFRQQKNKNLLYLANSTRVNFKCPGTNIRDTLIGLYTIPTECEISTDTLNWSPIQSVTVKLDELLTNSTSTGFDSTKLPIIDFNKTDKVHKSLKDIIEQIPDPNTPFTFNFTNDYTLKDVKTYSIIAYGTLSILVIIQYVILGIFLCIYCTRKFKNKNKKFQSALDSLSKFKRNINERDSFKKLKDNLRQHKDNIQTKLNDKRAHPSSPTLMLNSLRSSFRNKTDVGVDTADLASTTTHTRKVVYPPIPRY